MKIFIFLTLFISVQTTAQMLESSLYKDDKLLKTKKAYAAVLSDHQVVALASEVLNALDSKSDYKVKFQFQDQPLVLKRFDYLNNLALFESTKPLKKQNYHDPNFNIINRYGQRHLGVDLEYTHVLKFSHNPNYKLSGLPLFSEDTFLGLISRYSLRVVEGAKTRLAFIDSEFKYLRDQAQLISASFINEWLDNKESFQPMPALSNEVNTGIKHFYWQDVRITRKCRNRSEKIVRIGGNDGAGIGGSNGAGIGGDGEFIQDYGVNYSLSPNRPRCDFDFDYDKGDLPTSGATANGNLERLFKSLSQFKNLRLNYFTIIDPFTNQISWGEFKDSRSFFKLLLNDVNLYPLKTDKTQNLAEKTIEFLEVSTRYEKSFFERRSLPIYRDRPMRYNEKLFYLHNVIYKSIYFKDLSINERESNYYYEILHNENSNYDGDRLRVKLRDIQEKLRRQL